MLSLTPLFAQTNNLPYSRIGLGNLSTQSSVYHRNMGGIGVSLISPAHINFTNPALLVYNKRTIFDISINYEQYQLSTKKGVQNYRGGNLNYLAFAFPITKKITIGTGLQPYSNVNYLDKNNSLLPNTTTFAQYRYTGTGGITQVYGSLSYQVYQGLSVGMQLNYNFGSIQNTSESWLDDGNSLYILEVLNRLNFSDFSYRLGAVYRFEFENGMGINLGLTTDLATNLRANRFQAIQRKDQIREVSLRSDTLLLDTKSLIKLPASYQFGISVSKYRHYAIGVDMKQQKWSDYKGIANEQLADTREIRVGMMWTPDNRSVSSYLKRVSYQFGFYDIQSPIRINNLQIEDRGFSVGLSLPVSATLSSFNLGINVGERGTTSMGLIKARYVKVSLSMSINDHWFRKRRIF